MGRGTGYRFSDMYGGDWFLEAGYRFWNVGDINFEKM